MRFKRLDLNLLVALDHMLTLRSISRAAEQMNMSQSAMSNALTRLRDYFDDPLLVQIGRNMEPTPRAEAMREAVRDILVRIESTIDTVPEFRPDQSTREFSILMSDYTMKVLAPHILALADEAEAQVRFRFLPQSAEPYTLLERGEADLLIAPSPFCSADHPKDILYQDPFVCLVWKDGVHGGKPLTEEAFSAAGHVVMVPINNASSLETSQFDSLGLSRRAEVTTFSFSLLPDLVVGTNRIATVHSRTAAMAVEALPLESHPVPVKIDPLTQAMQWHQYRDRDAGILWLRGLVHEAVKRLPAGLSAN